MAEQQEQPTEETRKEALVRFIEEYYTMRGYAPSTREMADGIGLNSLQGIHRYLTELKEDGRVDWEPNHARTVRVIKDGDTGRVQ